MPAEPIVQCRLCGGYYARQEGRVERHQYEGATCRGSRKAPMDRFVTTLDQFDRIDPTAL